MIALRRVHDHIDRHFAEPIGLSDLSALSGPPLSPEAADFVRGQLETGQMGGLGLKVDDCQKTYAELTAKGVTFLQEPSDRPYGVEAVMRDNTGNWLVLVEPKAFTPADFE